MCDNHICHEHVEPRAHKESLWYICAEVKWRMQKAYFRKTFRKGNEASADICPSLTTENLGRSALRIIGRFSNSPIHDRRHFLSLTTR